MRRTKYAMALLSTLVFGQTVPIDVSFKMTELEKADHPLAGVPVRLVLGQVSDWQGPDAGHRFVTGADGTATFTMQGIVDRRWRMVPYAMTGLSFPKRMDHLWIAAELEQLIPTREGAYRHLQWLHTMEIDCYSADTSATSDISEIYTRDDKGRFARRGDYRPLDRLIMPDLGGMALGGPGYKASDFFLSPASEDRKHWKVRLTLQRKPAPVLR